MSDLFNLNPDDFSGKPKNQQSRKVDENLYNPGPDQGQNGIYKSIIRFVPWAEDTSKSRYQKYTAKLVNPLTNERLYIDCPSTLGKSSILWSLDTEIKKLKTEEPTVFEELSKYFSRSYTYYSPVYIKKDPQFPQLDGQIKIFGYGYTIDNLINQELNPEEELVTTQKINPFSLTQGKDFVLIIKRKTKTWRDFSSAKFMGEVSPLIITTGGNEIATSNDPKVAAFITEFLKKNTPDMTPYFYKEWAETDYELVANYIKAIVPYKQIIENLVANLKDDRLKKHFTNTKSAAHGQLASNQESLAYTPQATPQTKGSSLSVDIEQPEAEQAPQTTQKTKVASGKSTKVEPKETDDLDDLLNNM